METLLRPLDKFKDQWDDDDDDDDDDDGVDIIKYIT